MRPNKEKYSKRRSVFLESMTPHKISIETKIKEAGANQFIQAAIAYCEDAEYKQRIDKQYCRPCYYLHSSRVVMHAIHHKQCEICLQNCDYPNNYTDRLCLSCAVDNELCKHCFCDIELRNFPVRRPFDDMPTHKEELEEKLKQDR